jgi:murein L,D-transpeptidase YcbB/YkuD
MAGVIRYALFNPYWNVPEDLVQEELAPKVLAQGPIIIAQKHMETLYDWAPDAKVLDPATVDWSAVAAGRQYLRVRQVPGPANMMGKVKFMLPNDLGIYLHDTPNKALFAQDQRWFSSGCVRLEDADRLGRWLLGDTPEVSTPDYRVNLAQPVPVYITYFTVAPGPTGAVFRQDIYGRDEMSLAQLQHHELANAA